MSASREGPSDGAKDHKESLRLAAEDAILLVMADLQMRRMPLNSETVPPEAAKRLQASRPGLLAGVTGTQAMMLVDEAVGTLKAAGQIYAPVHPSIFWRRLPG